MLISIFPSSNFNFGHFNFFIFINAAPTATCYLSCLGHIQQDFSDGVLIVFGQSNLWLGSCHSCLLWVSCCTTSWSCCPRPRPFIIGTSVLGTWSSWSVSISTLVDSTAKLHKSTHHSWEIANHTLLKIHSWDESSINSWDCGTVIQNGVVIIIVAIIDILGILAYAHGCYKNKVL